MALERLGEKLRTLRMKRGLSQIKLGQALGYADGSYISQIETSRQKPTAEFVLKVSEYFGVSADVLLRDDLDLESVSDSSDT
jgi:transcriptional regulator with XRE-family HTH domain